MTMTRKQTKDALGQYLRSLGKRGGQARAAALTAAERREIARKGGQASGRAKRAAKRAAKKGR